MAKLLERIALERTGNVDRESGVIPGVKLIGLISKNGRRYTESALRKAASLYEGRIVNLNHVKPGQSRDVRDLAGAISKVEFREGQGLFGDLHYLKGDPAGEKVAALAESGIGNVGMSHDADGSIKRIGGENVVEEITAVNSVDVVFNPATTQSFKESTMKTTLRKLLEATPYKHTAKLLEMMPELAAEEPIDAPEVEETDGTPDPIDAVANALAAKVADAIKDPAISDAEVGQMAKAASKTVANVRADMEPKAEAPAEGDGDATEGDAEEEKTTEAIVAKHVGKLTEQIDSLTKERDARLVLESKDARVTPQLLDELTACKDRAAMEALVEGWAPAKLGKPKPAIGRLRESNASLESADSYLASLKARGLR